MKNLKKESRFENEEYELNPLGSRPIIKSAQVYYTDFNSEQKKSKFTITQHDWNIILRNCNSTKTLSSKAKTLMGNIKNMIIPIAIINAVYLSSLYT